VVVTGRRGDAGEVERHDGGTGQVRRLGEAERHGGSAFARTLWRAHVRKSERELGLHLVLN
jgi:hypothetical protein